MLFVSSPVISPTGSGWGVPIRGWRLFRKGCPSGLLPRLPLFWQPRFVALLFYVFFSFAEYPLHVFRENNLLFEQYPPQVSCSPSLCFSSTSRAP